MLKAYHTGDLAACSGIFRIKAGGRPTTPDKSALVARQLSTTSLFRKERSQLDYSATNGMITGIKDSRALPASHDEIRLNMPLRLSVAAILAFPDGSICVRLHPGAAPCLIGCPTQ
jgi:hypothetical protein